MLIKWTLLALASGAAVAVYEDVPRGVPPSRAGFFKRAEYFQCLDGSLRIPYNQVNDDYCDCPDGSDEPGSSACPEGRFYCRNHLHEAKMIPSSRVNDKICDCCDGSDEYEGGVECANICDELGKSAREEKEKTIARHKAGWEKRKQLALEGLTIKNEQEKNVVELRAELDKMQPEKGVLEEKKRAAEEKETAARDEHDKLFQQQRAEKKDTVVKKLFHAIDADSDGFLSLAELSKVSYLDVNGGGQVLDTEVTSYLEEGKPADLAYFTEKMYSSLKQLKRDLEAKQKREKDEAEQGEKDAGNKVDGEEGEQAAEDEDVVEEHAEEKRDEDDEEDVPFPPYSEETNSILQDANKARDDLRDLEKKISDMEGKIRETESFSSLDFGEDFAWAPLKGKCVEVDEGQYTYKMCPFEKTTQKEKGGYSETNLGNWKEWKSKYNVQLFSGGQQCWNGPERSTEVHVECGDDNELVETSEPGRCEYKFVLRSPAACEDPAKMQYEHQEL